ncbi:hypothetical protein PMAYCL1PPCAC_30624, partial [Pristionchus mayeri]
QKSSKFSLFCLPFSKMKHKKVADECGDICPICMENYNSTKNMSRTVSKCHHIFHRKCLSQWERTCTEQKCRRSCPVCRQQLTKM